MTLQGSVAAKERERRRQGPHNATKKIRGQHARRIFELIESGAVDERALVDTALPNRPNYAGKYAGVPDANTVEEFKNVMSLAVQLVLNRAGVLPNIVVYTSDRNHTGLIPNDARICIYGTALDISEPDIASLGRVLYTIAASSKVG